jgi:nitrate reductase assembly molybdenum cofactor insertion protein NarJ
MHATTTSGSVDSRQLRARSVSFALVARILGPDTTWLTDPDTVTALRTALATSGDRAALRRLEVLDRAPSPDPARLAGRWVRWFDLGRVAPYEGSNVASTAGGVTPRLADIAGFYRAFSASVPHDRPDHVVAQLEFLALTLLTEAEALERGGSDVVEVAAMATRSFLRDHIGGWIDAWAARVGAIDELAPWFPFAAVAAELVRREAAIRNVIPLRDPAALPADAGVAADEEAMLGCEDGVDSDLLP